MPSYRDPDPRSLFPHPRSQALRRANVFTTLLGGRRWLLVASLVLLAAAFTLQSLRAPSGRGVETAAPSSGQASASKDALTAPLGNGRLSQALPDRAQGGLTGSGAPGPSRPTPSTIRPLAAPTMPPVSDSRPAPTRKPGTPDPAPTSNHVVVVDGDSGAILFQRHGYDPVAPASLTKIMTAILGIEHGTLSDHVKTDVDASSLSDSTVMGLEPWFDVTLEDLLYGLMLPSGNDAALAIARYVAGSDEAFVQLMNQKAAWLGLRSTHFVNPHGLDAPDHYSSPYDMVVMARYAMQYPEFRKLAAARSYDISESNISYTIYNLNPILNSYPGADGVKIGYTDNAGRSIVATAVRNGHRVYVAFMRSEDGLVPETTALLDWAFSSFTWP